MAGGAFDKPINNSVNFNCPCKKNSIAITFPYYVGSDYYCESGVNIYVVHGIWSLLLTHCGMDSSVVVVVSLLVPAAHITT